MLPFKIRSLNFFSGHKKKRYFTNENLHALMLVIDRIETVMNEGSF